MIACIVPTIRDTEQFEDAWEGLFSTHNVELIIVRDGDNPALYHKDKTFSVKDIMGENSDLIYNFNDGVRNLGFAYVAKYLPHIKYILTLDDDVLPLDDPILAHLMALNSSVPVSWISTMLDDYPRGFPYKIRGEAEVVLSHGVWEGVKDWDAPNQLVRGNPEAMFYRGPIPKGIFYPMCGMNIMFKKKMLPYMYYAPMGK